LAQINSVLTLVGIAGFILTLGMAIDANVLINERIKEELSIGKNIRAAIRLGYEKASGSIIDSNITTLLTGIILYLYGSGTIKSFSLTFIIGIISSFFTAVYVSRLIFYIKEQSKSIKNMKFSLIFKGILLNTNFNFVRYRFFAYALSFILFCFGSFCFWKSKGFTYGIEFTGGYNIIVKLDKQVKSYDLEKFLVESLKEKINVKEYGSNSIFKMSMKAENLKSKENLMEKIKCNILDFLKNKDTQACEENNKENDVNDNVTFLSVERIEPSIAKDIIKNSSKAIIIVLLVLFLYIFIRFKKWQFSIVTILTLLHDMALIFAIYGISKFFGYTIIVNEIFIAAILTILGYTINNTIIIFDRIRENIRTNTDITFAENINKSVNVTLNRNLITTFSTLIVVIIIFMFGGITLEHFSFITLCGISLGTYSAIFISAPMLLDFVKKY
jgi:SecD/SecF fusion protein